MKTKIVIAIAMVAIFIFSGIIYSLSASTIRITSGESTIIEECSIEKTCAETTSQPPPDDEDDDEPELEVKVKARNLFRGWYLIWTTVKNLEGERITLTTARPVGGIRVTANIWETIYQKPGAIIMLAYPLSLRPHQKKIISIGLCNMEWYPSAYVYTISGYLSSYEYEGKTYPYTWGDRIVIWCGEVSQ